MNSQDLDHDKPTKGKIMTVIRAVHRWKSLADLFQQPNTSQLIAQMEGELNRLMEGLGARIKSKPVKQAKASPLASSEFLDSLS